MLKKIDKLINETKRTRNQSPKPFPYLSYDGQFEGLDMSREIITDFRAKVAHELVLKSNWLLDHDEDDITDVDIAEYQLLVKIMQWIDGTGK